MLEANFIIKSHLIFIIYFHNKLDQYTIPELEASQIQWNIFQLLTIAFKLINNPLIHLIKQLSDKE